MQLRRDSLGFLLPAALPALFAVSIAARPAPALADEPHRPAQYWRQRGYLALRPPSTRAVDPIPAWSAHSLPWPIQFQDSRHSLGNSMAEFQSYGSGPYYHGGCDLRVKARAEVRTPVGGRIEAGHYGYTNHPDGSSTKYWKPWPASGDPYYFEVAVITDDGHRFEFHHMDETHLSRQIQDLLAQGYANTQVAPGTLLGSTVAWPDHVYHHTHYNIIAPSGTQLNPEHYSPLLPDHQSPELQAVLAGYSSGKVIELRNGDALEAAPQFFAVSTVDHQDDNVYDHPPVYAALEFTGGPSFAWDFRERLSATHLNTTPKFPPIWDFFIDSLRVSSSGNTYSTEGGYGTGTSVIRLPVPARANGAFEIRLEDESGNATRFEGSLPKLARPSGPA
jgi:hypothetical protein